MKLINKLIALLLACAFITGCTPKPSNNDVQPHVTASPEVSVAAVVETDAPPTDDSFILNEPTMPEFTGLDDTALYACCRWWAPFSFCTLVMAAPMITAATKPHTRKYSRAMSRDAPRWLFSFSLMRVPPLCRLLLLL